MKKNLFPEVRTPSVPQVLGGFVALVGILSGLSVEGPFGTAILIASVVLAVYMAILGLQWLVYAKRSADLGDGARVPRLVPVDRLDPARQRRIFVYGSLLSPHSVVKAVNSARHGNSQLHALNCVPAKLYGYQQNWVEIGQVALRDRSAALVNRDCWLALSIEEFDATTVGERPFVNGAVIAVTEAEFQAIRDREAHYQEIDVSNDLVPISPQAEIEDKVVSFIGTTPRSASSDSKQYSIRKLYVERINAGLRALRLPPMKPPSAFGGKPVEIVDDLFAYEHLVKSLRSARGKVAQSRTQKRIREILIQDAPDEKKRSFGIAPLVLERGPYQSLIDTAQFALSGAVKITAALSTHRELLDHVGYSEDDIKALGRATELGALTPLVARADLVLTKGGARLLELNCDSPAGMRQIDVLSAQQAHLVRDELGLAWVDAQKTSAVDEVVRALLESRPGLKSCALVECDIPGWKSFPEMTQFVDRIRRAGVDSELLDIAVDKAAFDGDRLTCRGRTWDKIYKRVVWSDLSNQPGVRASRDALIQASIVHPDLISNSMGARVTGSKFVLAGLSDPSLRELAKLNEEEHRVAQVNVPWSALWGEEAPGLVPGNSDWLTVHNRVYKNPTAYVWKPVHGLAGHGIVFGHEERAYSRALEMNAASVVQEYVPHGRALSPVISLDERQMDWKYALFGVYMVNGKPVAVEAKLHDRLPVNMAQGAARTAVFSCKQ